VIKLKKILVITDNLPDQVNGVVTTFTNIELEAEKDGYKIKYLDPRSFPHVSCPGYPEVKLCWPRQIGKMILSEHPDYIHIATEGPLGVAARIWLDHKGWRYNTSYHTRFPEFLKKLYKVPEFITYAYIRWFHKHSGKVLTTTDAMVKELEEKGFSNVISWTRGINRQSLSPSGPRIFNRDTVLLSVGRISKEKNLDALIPLQYEFDIVVVGDGPYRSELESKMPAAQFVGYKSGRELADYYQAADVFVFTSMTDTFGLVMIESMSLGTPVAAYPVRGPLDVVEEGVNGYLNDDLYQAIKQCLELDRDTVKNSSEKWTWENCWKIFRDNLVRLNF
jgi:glycosyltransferase involved in cell wall biosynthesis